VPDYVRAAYLQNQSDVMVTEEERRRKLDRANNIQAVGGGVMNAAQMDLGEGKTPLSEALRYGKEKFGGGGGPAPNPAAPGPGGISRGPAPVSSALPSGQHGMQGGSPLASAVRSAPPVEAGGGGAPMPSGGGTPQDILKFNGLDAGKAMGNPTPVPIPAKPEAFLPSGMSIPTGPGPQAATKVPIDKMIGMQMEGIGSNTAANMTAQVGGKTAQSAVQAPVAANIASKGATEAVGKGLGGAFAGAGGAAVPVVGGAIGAIPAALRGDTYGAIKGGVGGAASSTLMAAGPAMAAAGPVGWAGMAGLAALSLYGMLG
jgi:hypothetical protein